MSVVAAMVAGALAATPGGFRSGEGLPVRSVAIRSAVVPGAFWVSQTTLRGRYTAQSTSATLELPILLIGDPPAGPELGLGQVRLAGLVHLGRSDGPVAFAAGLEVAFPVMPQRWRPNAWAENARSALPSVDALAIYELSAFPKTPFVVRTAFGAATVTYEGRWLIWTVVAAQVVPIAGPFAAVVEGEAGADYVDAAGRALARVALPARAQDGQASDPITVDLGGQLSWVDRTAFPALLLQIRMLFGPGVREPGAAEGGVAR